MRSGGERKKVKSKEKVVIADGDVIELIPGHHFFKYVSGLCSKKIEIEEPSSKRKRKHVCG